MEMLRCFTRLICGDTSKFTPPPTSPAPRRPKNNLLLRGTPARFGATTLLESVPKDATKTTPSSCRGCFRQTEEKQPPKREERPGREVVWLDSTRLARQDLGLFSRPNSCLAHRHRAGSFFQNRRPHPLGGVSRSPERFSDPQVRIFQPHSRSAGSLHHGGGI